MDNSMTNGDLQSLGAMLRQAREQRALTFDEVETQTRIRVKFLQALESGDLSLLPSLAHARGFLRNYAQFLHLDANAIIAQLAS
jgi:cytoskeletal protein RodZ